MMMMETFFHLAMLHLLLYMARMHAHQPSKAGLRTIAHQLLLARDKKLAMLQFHATLEMMSQAPITHQPISAISFSSNTVTLNGKTRPLSHAMIQLLCKTSPVMLSALMLMAFGKLELPTLTQINQFSEPLEKLLRPKKKREVSEMRISNA